MNTKRKEEEVNTNMIDREKKKIHTKKKFDTESGNRKQEEDKRRLKENKWEETLPFSSLTWRKDGGKGGNFFPTRPTLLSVRSEEKKKGDACNLLCILSLFLSLSLSLSLSNTP